MPDKARPCQRCSRLLLQDEPFAVLEISRLAGARPGCERHLLCHDCMEAIVAYLRMGPVGLDELVPDPEVAS